jgi:uncharacterized protein YkwD
VYIRGSLLVFVAMVVTFVGGLWLQRLLLTDFRAGDGCPHSRDLPTHEEIEAVRAAVLCLLNEERARHGLPALARNPTLELASQRHSADMVARDYFEHETPDGIDPASRMFAAGYPRAGHLLGENLYWGGQIAPVPIDAVDAWLESPGHRANLLRPEFTDVGVGVAFREPVRRRQERIVAYTTDFGGRAVP